MSPETDLVAAAQAGDHEAFERLVALYQRPVFGLCYRMLGNIADADDAAQDVFLRAYRHLARYDRERSFSTWLLSIAAHHCIDRLRRRRNTVLSLDALPLWRYQPADGPDPERAVVQADEAGHIARHLQRLPPEYRLVLVLRYWHDLGYEQIAGMLGDTVPAVKSRLHRARRLLAAELGSDSSVKSTESTRVGDAEREPPAVGASLGGIVTCLAN